MTKICKCGHGGQVHKDIYEGNKVVKRDCGECTFKGCPCKKFEAQVYNTKDTFNLSEKKGQGNSMGFEQPVYEEKDIKEFLKRLKEENLIKKCMSKAWASSFNDKLILRPEKDYLSYDDLEDLWIVMKREIDKLSGDFK